MQNLQTISNANSGFFIQIHTLKQAGKVLANTPATLGLVPASNPVSTPSLGPPTNSVQLCVVVGAAT